MSSGTNELDIYRVKCEIERVALQSVVAPAVKTTRDALLEGLDYMITLRHVEGSEILRRFQLDFTPYLEGNFGNQVKNALEHQADAFYDGGLH
ncbi:hypothetical protein [Abiotrophia defectiva]|uniref:hypothetical protein n=1 Tax=Abiotrophia defectiva TaxID=46125 RepID=UPI0028D7FA22|nr:hypothetical protein [Abiotrophia defectiva]